jgi:hypothetical protein
MTKRRMLEKTAAKVETAIDDRPAVANGDPLPASNTDQMAAITLDRNDAVTALCRQSRTLRSAKRRLSREKVSRGTRVCGLAAGGRRIRTLGPPLKKRGCHRNGTG